MIFKTINSSVDETRKTLALFNKDWDTYKRNWQNANGVFGKIGSVFTPANAITKSDIEAIKAYNSQIDSCVTSQTAFNRTMLNASPAAQNLVASYNGGKVSAQGMATAQNAAKTSTIGLTIAQTALNAAIGMGIGLLVSLVVKGIDKLIHANEEAIEKAEELRRKYDEFKSTNESNVTTLKRLEKEFKELSKGVSQYGENVSLTTEQYERYKEIIQQIVGMSPSLAEGYSTENGYIADKNGLLERAIELQEQEYRNELRKITNLDNLKTSMSGYIAEYKEAFGGGWVTDDMSATITPIATDLSKALYNAFNLNGSGKHNYDNAEKVARKIIESLGIVDVDAEIQKFVNKNGYYESSWFFKAYADTIAENIEVITNSLSADDVGLDDTIFDQNIEKLDSAAQSYIDMKDAISMTNESIQRDLGYIAEYADGYSDLSTEQQKFVNEFLKGFNISDIMSKSNNPFDQGWKFDEDKMASVKSQITKFVEALSQDEATKNALEDLYAIPTNEQSIGEFVEQFRNALEVIQAYCKENGIEIPIAISDNEHTINDLEAQYQRAVDFAKDKFDDYDPTAFFKEHSINTQEEIDAWQKIAQGAMDAAEAEREYLGQTPKEPVAFSTVLSDESLSKFQSTIDSLKSSLTTLYNGNYSSTDLISSLTNINKALSDIGKADVLNWEEITNIDDLDNVIDQITNEYVDGMLNLDMAGTDFGNTIRNVIQEELKASRQLETYKSNVSDLQTAYSNLTDVIETYNANGYITFDQLTSLLEMEPQYLSCLIDDNGQLQLNTQAMADLAQLRLDEARAQVVQEAISELNRLSEEKQTQAVNDNSNAYIQNIKTIAQWNDALGTAMQNAGLAAPLFAELSTALGGAVSSGASDEAINQVLDNAYKKFQMIDQMESSIGSNLGDVLGKTGSGASSSAKSEFSETIDFFKQRVEELKNALSLLDATMDNVAGSFGKNNLIDAKLGITEEEFKNYTDALSMYTQKANEAFSKIPAEIASKVKDGAVALTDFIGDGNKDVVEAIKEYESWAGEISSCQKELAELQSTIRQLELQKFNNIMEDFQNHFNLRGNSKDLISKQIDLLKEAGELIGESFFTAQIDQSKKQLELLENEKAQLVSQMSSAISSGRVNCCPLLQ